METFSILNKYGLYFGNLIASLVAVIFILGAPTSKERNIETRLWAIFWASIVTRYLFDLLIEISTSPFFFKLFYFLLDIADIAGSVALTTLYFSYYSKNKFPKEDVIPISTICYSIPYALFLIFLLVDYHDSAVTNTLGGIAMFVANVTGFMLLFLIGWEMRTKSITSALIFVGYGLIQGIGQLRYFSDNLDTFTSKNMEVALLMKFALIASIYKILDIKGSE